MRNHIKLKFLLPLLALLLASCLEGPNNKDDQLDEQNGGGNAPPINGQPSVPVGAPTPGNSSGSTSDPNIDEKKFPVSSLEACLLRWPGEFVGQAREFCSAHAETARGDQMDEKLYPNVRQITTEDEFIAALAEKVSYKRLILNKLIILRREARFRGPAVIEGPQMLIFEDAGRIVGSEPDANSTDPSCRFYREETRVPFSNGMKLRITAETRNFNFQQLRWDSPIAHIVLEGKLTGQVSVSGNNEMLVVVNNEIEVVRNSDMKYLVLLSSILKANFNDAGGSQVFNSLALSSRFLDPVGGKIDFADCWDRVSSEKTEMSSSARSLMDFNLRFTCQKWQNLAQNWAQCGGVQ